MDCFVPATRLIIKILVVLYRMTEALLGMTYVLTLFCQRYVLTVRTCYILPTLMQHFKLNWLIYFNAKICFLIKELKKI